MTATSPLACSPDGFRAAWDAVSSVEGWLTVDQAEELWNRARDLSAGDAIVEIGSFRGRSTVLLARAAPDGVEVVAIDPHGGTDRGPQEWEGKEAEALEDHEVFHENLRSHRVDDRVRHVRTYSSDALAQFTGSAHLLFIDGAHRWRPCRDDIRSWGARVPEGGVMLIHDSFSSRGVTAALVTELFLSSEWRYEGRHQSLARYRRVQVSGWERLHNVGRQARELPLGAAEPGDQGDDPRRAPPLHALPGPAHGGVALLNVEHQERPGSAWPVGRGAGTRRS